MRKYAGIVLTIVVFAVLWQGISVLVRLPFLPGPVEVSAALFRLAAEGRLRRHTGASLFRIVCALIVSGIPAAALGIAAGRSSTFNRIISPFIYLIHPLPKAAFLPVIMLFFGIGEFSKIILIGFIIFSQILVTMRDTARNIDEGFFDVIRSMGANNIDVTRHVMIPAMLPGFFTGLRVSLGTAVAVLFLAETFASENGLGYLIVDAWTRIAYTEMYAAILALSLLGLVLFFLTDLLEFLLCPWKRRV